MARILVIVGIALLLITRASAQSETNCEQIRQAVATYGYAAARQHALEHYGAEAVAAGDKCLPKEIPAKEGATKASAKPQHPKHRKAAASPTKSQPK
jgi:hypothetical protein